MLSRLVRSVRSVSYKDPNLLELAGRRTWIAKLRCEFRDDCLMALLRFAAIGNVNSATASLPGFLFRRSVQVRTIESCPKLGPAAIALRSEGGRP